MSKYLKIFFYNILKIVCSIVLFIALFWGTTVATSFLSRWTADNPIEDIPYLCFVAVDSEEKFLRFQEINEKPISESAISAKTTGSKKENWDYWELTTSEHIRTVQYAGDDYSSQFRYRVHEHGNNREIEPLSCRINGIGTGLFSGLLLMSLFVMFLFIKEARTIYCGFKSRKIEK